MPDTPDPVAVALDEIRGRGYHNGETGAMAHRLSDAAAIDVPRLLAALDRVLELTDPMQNPSLGGMFLAALGQQIRREITPILLGEESNHA